MWQISCCIFLFGDFYNLAVYQKEIIQSKFIFFKCLSVPLILGIAACKFYFQLVTQLLLFQ